MYFKAAIKYLNVIYKITHQRHEIIYATSMTSFGADLIVKLLLPFPCKDIL